MTVSIAAEYKSPPQAVPNSQHGRCYHLPLFCSVDRDRPPVTCLQSCVMQVRAFTYGCGYPCGRCCGQAIDLMNFGRSGVIQLDKAFPDQSTGKKPNPCRHALPHAHMFVMKDRT
eukprot:scaffold331919_cov38-Prasinocladus_malaysianus.AAC.1